jgi:hypothetical protein
MIGELSLIIKKLNIKINVRSLICVLKRKTPKPNQDEI